MIRDDLPLLTNTNNPDWKIFNNIQELCSNLNHQNITYNPFIWEAASTRNPNIFPIFDIIIYTKYSRKISFRESVGKAKKNVLKKTLNNIFNLEFVERYMEEYCFLLELLKKKLNNFEIYEFNGSPLCADTWWLGVGFDNDKNFISIEIYLPEYLDYSPEDKQIRSLCSLLIGYVQDKKSCEKDIIHLPNDNLDIISLGVEYYPFLSQNKMEEWIESNFFVSKKIPNDYQMTKIDSVERQKLFTETKHILDEKGFEIELKTQQNQNDGYWVEIYGQEYEIILRGVSEKDRLRAIKKQIYSHIYDFDAFFDNVWRYSEDYIEYLYKSSQNSESSYAKLAKINSLYQLSDLFTSSLDNLQIYSIGRGETNLYLVGKTKSNNWIGIHRTMLPSSD